MELFHVGGDWNNPMLRNNTPEGEIVEKSIGSVRNLTQFKSLVNALLVNVAWRLATKTLFGQETPKFHAEKTPTSVVEEQRVQNLLEQLAAILQEVNLPKIQV